MLHFLIWRRRCVLFRQSLDKLRQVTPRRCKRFVKTLYVALIIAVIIHTFCEETVTHGRRAVDLCTKRVNRYFQFTGDLQFS